MDKRATQSKPDPEKHCEACGARLVRKRGPTGTLESLLHFGRRKFCDQKCLSAGFKGRYQEEVQPAEGRYRARTLYSALKCEQCGSTRNVDRHHRDENPLNNAPENVQSLCRRCHYRTHNPVQLCAVEGCEQKRRRHGYCEKHSQRFLKTGDPLKTLIPERKPCSIAGCSELANAKGLCGKHYMQKKRANTLP